PDVHAESAGEFGADPFGVFGGEHGGEAALVADAALDGVDNFGVGVAGHGAGVAEGEVEVLMAVDVPDTVAVGAVEVEGESAGFVVHPGHGYAAEEVVGTLVGGLGFGVRGGEALSFALVELGESGAV